MARAGRVTLEHHDGRLGARAHHRAQLHLRLHRLSGLFEHPHRGHVHQRAGSLDVVPVSAVRVASVVVAACVAVGERHAPTPGRRLQRTPDGFTAAQDCCSKHGELQRAFSILRHEGLIWLVSPEGGLDFWRQRRHRLFGACRSSLSKNRSCLLTPRYTVRRHGAEPLCIRLLRRISPRRRPPYQPTHNRLSPPPCASHSRGVQRSLATPTTAGVCRQ